MRTFRPERVSKLIMEKLNALFLRHVEIPGSLLTITAVTVSPDLSRAVVKVSVLPSKNSGAALAVLNKIQKGLQYRLQRKINIKPMPQIVFEIDYGPEKAAGVEKALLKDNNNSKARNALPTGDVP